MLAPLKAIETSLVGVRVELVEEIRVSLSLDRADAAVPRYIGRGRVRAVSTTNGRDLTLWLEVQNALDVVRCGRYGYAPAIGELVLVTTDTGGGHVVLRLIND